MDSICPKCGGPAICTARQDDICLDDECGYAGTYYRDAHSDYDMSHLNEIRERNERVERGGSYYN